MAFSGHDSPRKEDNQYSEWLKNESWNRGVPFPVCGSNDKISVKEIEHPVATISEIQEERRSYNIARGFSASAR